MRVCIIKFHIHSNVLVRYIVKETYHIGWTTEQNVAKYEEQYHG